MRIIIDGYNVIKKFYYNELITNDQRIRFLNELSTYSKKRNHDIVVVFDGGLLSYPEKVTHKDVKVVYAGTGQTADDYIIKLLTILKGERLLVSSDRQLCIVAAQNETVSIDSLSFYNIVLDVIKSNKKRKYEPIGQIKKMASSDSVELDALMQEASLALMPKAEDSWVEDEKLEKMSKVERRLHTIIKKL